MGKTNENDADLLRGQQADEARIDFEASVARSRLLSRPPAALMRARSDKGRERALKAFDKERKAGK